MRKSIGIFGNDIGLSAKGTVKISMYEYVDNPLQELPLDMRCISKKPITAHLFNINTKAEKLNKDKPQLF